MEQLKTPKLMDLATKVKARRPTMPGIACIECGAIMSPTSKGTAHEPRTH